MIQDSDADARAISLFETLATLSDVSLRIAWLRSEMAASTPGIVAEVLEVVAHGADAGLTLYREGLVQLVIALAPASFDSLRRDAATHAIIHRLESARALLVPESVPERSSRVGRGSPATPGRATTLGERKSLARRRAPGIIERITADPHPDVIRILLSNPSLREPDVLRIASKRPIAPDVLREILVHPRWFVRYPVRFALLQNPGLPTNLGLALVRSLHRQDAQSIAASAELAESIRLAARAELERPPLH